MKLYQSSKTNISEHIKHIFEEGELTEESTVQKFRTVQIEGDFPTKKDIKIAKKYLTKDELKTLNNLASACFDLAEINAIEHKTMYMSDYVEHLDRILSSTGKEVLDNAESISHKPAMEKVEAENQKFIQKNLSPVEKAYLESIKLFPSGADLLLHRPLLKKKDR